MKRIFIIILSIFAVVSVSSQIYNVRDYGAVSDTTKLSTFAIQKAIDLCTDNGGGTVLVPAGNYLSSTIYLKDNVDLHVDAGATIYASRKVTDYPKISKLVGASDFESVEVLLSATGAKNISLTGKGMLHCRAERYSYQRSEVRAVTDSVTGREVYNAAQYGADYRTKYKKVPPYTTAVSFTDCYNVHIRDIQVLESSGWGVHLQWCDRVLVDGIYIESNPINGVNSDGLDIDGCSNVMVSNCNIDTGDDALCFKTTMTNGRAEPCRWITVTNCILKSSSGALKFGTETHADFENITISNCVINDANRGLCIIVRDGGAVRNVTMSNMVIHTVRKAPFWWGNGDPLWFTIQKRDNVAVAGGIENINIENVIAYGQSGVRIEGFDNIVENIRIRNFQLFMEPENAVDKRARDGYLFYGIDGLSLIDCSVKWNTNNPQKEWRKAYSFDNIKNLELFRVKGVKAPNSNHETFSFKDIKGLVIDGNEIKNK